MTAQEPVAWRTFDGEGGWDYRSYEDNENYRDVYIKRNGNKYASWVEPLYTHPSSREWVGLTDEEAMQIIDVARNGSTSGFGFMRVARAIEAKLKEKNA